MEIGSEEYYKVCRKVSREIEKKFNYTRVRPFREYYALEHFKSTLDGQFTAEELRIIADGMDTIRRVVVE